MSRRDCQQALDHLQDFLKREITPELAAEVREHLDRCKPCFRHARFEANFLEMLETRASKGTCPRQVRERILAMLRTESKGD